MPPPLIHIGYHKTGTTWLQTSLFNNPAAGYTTPVPASTILERLVRPKPLDFDAESCRAALVPAISRAMDSGLVAVISAERLSGNPHSGGYDAYEIAVRLKNVLPAAKILIVIREQVSAIASCYNQYVKVGGTLSLAGYLDPPRDFRLPQFDFDYFKYHRLVELYRGLRGAERVLVLAYEEFLKEPLAFLAKLNAFSENRADLEVRRLPLGMKANVSLDAGVVWLQRLANRIAAERTTINPHAWLHDTTSATTLSSAVRSAGALLPRSWHRASERRAADYIREQVSDRYADSNRLMAQLVGLPLSALGYRA